MTRYKATIAYDGTDFAGFQSQTNQRTVQKEIEKILTKLNSFEPVILQGSGRTDSGVHAFGQVIHFDLKGKVRDLERLRFGLDTQTPADLAVKKVELVPDAWHAGYQKHEKTYEYYLETSITRSPFQRHSKAYFRYPLNFERMQEAMSKLVGEHDFVSFCNIRTNTQDTVRTVYDLIIEKKDDEIVLRITGNGFLYNMVRIIAGVLIRVGRGFYAPEKVKEILDAKVHTSEGATAPPNGLVLMKIDYN
mgnify:CR=1 FL=1